MTSTRKSRHFAERFPTLVPLLAAAGFLGLFQAMVLVWANQDVGGLEMALGMGRLGLISGFFTMFLLFPVVAVLRRLHPEGQSGPRHRATWPVCFGLAVAVVAWMVTDRWTAGPLVPDAFRLGTGDRPDVVLVTIDTLRADFLGAYGYSPSLTPEMDRIAEEGVVFRRILAPAPWTVPSIASLLTGLPSVRHGAGRPLSASGPAFLRSSLASKHTTLAERFAAAGYRTRGVVSNGFLSVGILGDDQGEEA